MATTAGEANDYRRCPNCGTDLGPGTACPICATVVEQPDPDAPTVMGQSESDDEHERVSHTTDPLTTLSGESDDQRYEVQAALGRGGMATVVSAFDRDLRRTVAMKLIADDADLVRRLRFVSEAHILGQLEHPNIVPIYGLGVHRASERLYFTMKRMEGHTLEYVLDGLRAGDERPEWSLWRLLGVFVGICNGVGFAHMRGVIHRDLKPSNIMTGAFGQIMVMDWGLAKVLRTDGGIESSDAAHLEADRQRDGTTTSRRRRSTIRHAREDSTHRDADTLAGEVLGTPQYMAPEQAEGRIDELDERTDIYSLGAILYEILCLQPPIPAGTTAEMVRAAKAGRIEAPEIRAPYRQIPRELSAIAMKALAKDPGERYPSVRDLRADIHAFLAHRPVSVHQDRPLERLGKLVRRNPVASAAIAIGGLLLAVTVAIAFVVNLEARHTAEERLAELIEAQQERERSEARRRVAEATADDLEERIRADAHRPWVLGFEEEFGPGWQQRWRTSTGWYQASPLNEAQLADWFALRADGLHVDPDQNLALSHRAAIPTEVRAQLEATYLGGRDGAMHLVLHGQYWRQGYIFQVGGFDNTRAVIARGDDLYALAPETLAEAPFTLRTGERYQITASSVLDDGELLLSLIINGEPILVVHDRRPLESGGRGSLALLANGPADTVWHRLRVWHRAEPAKPDLLATAERHLQRGNFITARDLFVEVARSTDDATRRARAEHGLERSRHLAELEERLPSWLARIEQMMPSGGQTSLEVTGRGLLLRRAGEIPDLELFGDLPLRSLYLTHASGGEGRRLDLDHLETDRLRSVVLLQTNVVDLEPLRGAPLEVVEIINDRPAGWSLAPLANAPLRTLRANYAVQDFHLLDTSRLESLSLAGLPITDLDWLRGSPLTDVRLIGLRRISDIEPIAGPQLTHLRLYDLPITDLGPLAGTRLESLLLIDCPVTDLRPLAGLPLKQLQLRLTGSVDLSALSHGPLRSCSLTGCPGTDLRVLGTLELESLSLAEMPDIELPSWSKPTLRMVELRELDIRAVDSFAGQPLISFSVEDCPVDSVAPILGPRLTRLRLRDTAVDDLSALAGHRLDHLDVAGSPVTDLEPLAGAPLRILVVDLPQLLALVHAGTLRRLPLLRQIELVGPHGEVIATCELGD